MGLPDAATQFQEAGITALIFDPRCTGLSEGQPRNDIDPFKQVEDMSDALTFLNSLPQVDPMKTGFWGMSFGGVVAVCAASLDKRAKFVIAVCPLTDFEFSPEKRPQVMMKAMRDRESQLMGNTPFYLPMMTSKGENPVGFGQVADKSRYAKLVDVGKEIARNHVNRTTLQTYYKILMWQPFPLWKHLTPTPIMFVIPELDSVSLAEIQKSRFEDITSPKRLHIEPGVDHEDILQGEQLYSVMTAQLDFVRDALSGLVK